MLTTTLILLIFRLGSGLYFATKNTVHKIYLEKQETFFQSVFEWSKRHTIFEQTTTCTLPQAIPYSLFHDKMLHFVEKKYRRHNNLMTGVLWRTLRSKYNKSNFLVLQKRYFGRGNFTFWRIEYSYLFFVTFCNLAAQSGKRRE